MLTGSDFSLRLDDERLDQHQDLWNEPLASESRELYRAAYLAAGILDQALASGITPDWPDAIRAAVDSRLDEGYDRGVHDHDAILLITAWAEVASGAGPLLHPSHVRADALWHWFVVLTAEERARWLERGEAAAALGHVCSCYRG